MNGIKHQASSREYGIQFEPLVGFSPERIAQFYAYAHLLALIALTQVLEEQRAAQKAATPEPLGVYKAYGDLYESYANLFQDFRTFKERTSRPSYGYARPNRSAYVPKSGTYTPPKNDWKRADSAGNTWSYTSTKTAPKAPAAEPESIVIPPQEATYGAHDGTGRMVSSITDLENGQLKIESAVHEIPESAMIILPRTK